MSLFIYHLLFLHIFIGQHIIPIWLFLKLYYTLVEIFLCLEWAVFFYPWSWHASWYLRPDIREERSGGRGSFKCVSILSEEHKRKPTRSTGERWPVLPWRRYTAATWRIKVDDGLLPLCWWRWMEQGDLWPPACSWWPGSDQSCWQRLTFVSELSKDGRSFSVPPIKS